MQTDQQNFNFYTVFGNQKSLLYYERIALDEPQKRKLFKIFTNLNYTFKKANELFPESLVASDKKGTAIKLLQLMRKDLIQTAKNYKFEFGIESGILDFINIKYRNLDFISSLNKGISNNDTQ